MDKLEEILASRRRRVAEDMEKISFQELERFAKQEPRGTDFIAAIDRTDRVGIIAEMKRKSPSAGRIRVDFDAARIARSYEKGGAAALSVLTERDNFEGQLLDLEAAHAASGLPILRKDFIFDPYQIVEARVAGASAVLLIADMVPSAQLKELAAYAEELGLAALVEVFTRESLAAALASGSKVIGINTRNLRTLEMDPGRVSELLKDIPGDRLIVAESGIKTAGDMEELKKSRVAAALVGESLLKQNDLAQAVEALAKAGVR